MLNQLRLSQQDCFQNDIPDFEQWVFYFFAVRKVCSNKVFIRKITIGISDFESISRKSLVREKLGMANQTQ